MIQRPSIFTVTVIWDEEASGWSGHCDDIPAAADAPSLVELLAKILAMAIDVLPDNHPDIDHPDIDLLSLRLQLA